MNQVQRTQHFVHHDTGRQPKNPMVVTGEGIGRVEGGEGRGRGSIAPGRQDALSERGGPFFDVQYIAQGRSPHRTLRCCRGRPWCRRRCAPWNGIEFEHTGGVIHLRGEKQQRHVTNGTCLPQPSPQGARRGRKRAPILCHPTPTIVATTVRHDDHHAGNAVDAVQEQQGPQVLVPEMVPGGVGILQRRDGTPTPP